MRPHRVRDDSPSPGPGASAPAPMPPEAGWLLERFGDLIVGLIHYGSTAFGAPHSGSTADFWVIVEDLLAFHRRFAGASQRALAARRIALNRDGPCFFAVHEGALHLKMGVISRRAFGRWCRARSFYVKGRMQKPLRILRAEPDILAAIADARRDGVDWALDLLPARFTFEQFLLTLLGLSYRTEIRPEWVGRKVQSILRAGREELERIYRPLLEAHENVTKTAGGAYEDRRPASEKRLARHRALQALRRMRWSGETFRNIWRNYLTHPRPIRYILRKVGGEIEKLLPSKRRDGAAGGEGSPVA